MKNSIKANIRFLWILLFWGTTVFQINSITAFGQETKQEKCGRLADCMEIFYKECLNDEYLNTFSPELVISFPTNLVNHDLEMARLDNYLEVLSNRPNSIGYIVAYGGRTNKYGEYDIRVGRIRRYIIGFRSFDESRIKFVNGGFREKFEFELWTSPTKNAFPPLSPTITPEKARFKGTMKLPAPGDSVL